jgi:hypothetical protein
MNQNHNAADKCDTVAPAHPRARSSVETPAMLALVEYTPPAPANAPTHPDAELLALGREFDARHARYLAALDIFHALPEGSSDDFVIACADATDEIRHSMADIPATTPAGIAAKARAFCALEFGNFEDHSDGLYHDLKPLADSIMLDLIRPADAPTAADAGLIALGHTFDIIGARADQVSNAFESNVFNADLKKQSDDLHDAARNLGLRILATPATTVKGLQVKARCALWCDSGLVEENDGEFNDGAALASLVQDVLAMAEINPPAAPAAILSAPAAANHNGADLRVEAAA